MDTFKTKYIFVHPISYNICLQSEKEQAPGGGQPQQEGGGVAGGGAPGVLVTGGSVAQVLSAAVYQHLLKHGIFKSSRCSTTIYNKIM